MTCLPCVALLMSHEEECVIALKIYCILEPAKFKSLLAAYFRIARFSFGWFNEGKQITDAMLHEFDTDMKEVSSYLIRNHTCTCPSAIVEAMKESSEKIATEIEVASDSFKEACESVKFGLEDVAKELKGVYTEIYWKKDGK